MTKKYIKLSVFVMSISLISHYGHAAKPLDKIMEGMYTNTTSPSIYQNQSQMGLIGGDFAMRTAIKNVNIISIAPPRISAGCGGIDLFGGSFSFINKDALVALMRQTAQNAVGLLFKLALDSINPMLGSKVTEFMNKLQEMNALLKNSCAIAQGAINMLKEPSKISKSIEDTSKQVKTSFASTTDAFTEIFTSTWDHMSGKTNTEGGGAATGGPAADFDKSVNLGNGSWRAIIRSQSYLPLADSSFNEATQAQMVQLMINVMGSIIIDSKKSTLDAQCPPAPAGISVGPKCDMPGTKIVPQLTIELLIDPGEAMLPMCVFESGAGSILRERNCFKMEQKKLSSVWTGTKVMVDKGLDHIITTIQNGQPLYASGGNSADATNPDEMAAQQLLAMTPMPIYTYMLRLQRSPAGMRQMKNLLGTDLEVLIATTLMRDIVLASKMTMNSPQNEKVEFPSDSVANLEAMSQLIATKEGAILNQVDKLQKIEEIVQRVYSALPHWQGSKE